MESEPQNDLSGGSTLGSPGSKRRKITASGVEPEQEDSQLHHLRTIKNSHGLPVSSPERQLMVSVDLNPRETSPVRKDPRLEAQNSGLQLFVDQNSESSDQEQRNNSNGDDSPLQESNKMYIEQREAAREVPESSEPLETPLSAVNISPAPHSASHIQDTLPKPEFPGGAAPVPDLSSMRSEDELAMNLSSARDMPDPRKLSEIDSLVVRLNAQSGEEEQEILADTSVVLSAEANLPGILTADPTDPTDDPTGDPTADPKADQQTDPIPGRTSTSPVTSNPIIPSSKPSTVHPTRNTLLSETTEQLDPSLQEAIALEEQKTGLLQQVAILRKEAAAWELRLQELKSSREAERAEFLSRLEKSKRASSEDLADNDENTAPIVPELIEKLIAHNTQRNSGAPDVLQVSKIPQEFLVDADDLGRLRYFCRDAQIRHLRTGMKILKRTQERVQCYGVQLTVFDQPVPHHTEGEPPAGAATLVDARMEFEVVVRQRKLRRLTVNLAESQWCERDLAEFTKGCVADGDITRCFFGFIQYSRLVKARIDTWKSIIERYSEKTELQWGGVKSVANSELSAFSKEYLSLFFRDIRRVNIYLPCRAGAKRQMAVTLTWEITFEGNGLLTGDPASHVSCTASVVDPETKQVRSLSKGQSAKLAPLSKAFAALLQKNSVLDSLDSVLAPLLRSTAATEA